MPFLNAGRGHFCRTSWRKPEDGSINRHRSAFADFGIFAVRDFASAHLRVRNRDPERLYKLGETHSTTLLSFTLPLSLFSSLTNTVDLNQGT